MAPRQPWRTALAGWLLVAALLIPALYSPAVPPVHADGEAVTPTATPTPENWGGGHDDDDG